MDVTVTIKLTGRDYRTLCRELEYHARTLKEAVPPRTAGPQAVHEAQQRYMVFQDVRQRVSE